jgi:hypothetical protein
LDQIHSLLLTNFCLYFGTDGVCALVEIRPKTMFGLMEQNGAE